jgi:hypothetical protein
VCSYTFTYAAPGTAKDSTVVATATVHGHRQVIARGELRHHRLALAFRHLSRGRYLPTVLALDRHGNRTVIGHTSIVGS